MARPGKTFSLIGLGALLACSVLPAHAQYADWNANPPKILPNERPGSGATFLTGSGRQFPNGSAFAVLRSDGSVATWGAAGAGGNFSIADTIYTNYSYYGETTYTPVDGNISSNVRAVYSNGGAFAALKSDGSLVTWGYGPSGGKFSVSSEKSYPRQTIYTAASGNITSDVTAVYSTSAAFAALKADGSLVTWGSTYRGGDSTAVAASLNSNVKAVYSNSDAFAAVKTDGSVVTWGDATTGGNSTAVAGSLASNVTAVYATGKAFAALKADGSVVTWGDAQFGANSTAVAGNLTSNVTALYSNQGAFAALKNDGSVVTWGYAEYGGNSTAVASSLTSNVTAVYATQRAFAALKTNGSVVTWGDPDIGGSSALVAHKLTSNVSAIYSTGSAFAALKSDGSVVAWGFAYGGGDSSAVADKLSSDVTAVYSTGEAFAAVKTDGSVATWGRSYNGGDSTAVAASLTSNVTAVYSNPYAFAALKSDGSITAWGRSDLGGSGAPSATGFTSVQSVFYIPSGALVTAGSSALASTTATLLGEVVREGNSPVTARGFVYALASVTDPEIGDAGVTQVTDSGSGLGNFTKVLSGLTPNTAYVFRAYVINDEGTTYGSMEDFSTNLPPVIISDGGNTNVSLSVAENSTAVSTVSATDADPGQTITYSISGGADAARFSIGATSGVVTFSAAPDYEAPADANADNVYQVIVAATDNGNPPKSATQTLSVTVTNEIDNGVLAVEQPAGTSLASSGTANFGSLTIGQTTELTFTLRSQGEASLLMQSGAVISGAAASEYSLIGSVPVSLASDGNTTFTVRFSPTTSGNRLATLSIPTNDTRPGRSPYTITLSGTALATSTIATYANAANQVRGGWINGENFTIGAVGTTNPGNNWPSAEGPDKVVDSNTGSKFLIFRNSNAGLVFSPSNSNVVFNRLSLSTANDASERDPASYVIYGSTTSLSGTAGTNISLAELTELASGTITLPDNRTTGPTVVQFANTTAYASYIVAFPTVRSTAGNNLTQISEVQLSQGINPPFAVAMAGARGGQLSSGTFTFGSIGSSNPGTNWNANENPDQAIDGSVSTKYLLFRNTGAGLIASPQAGPARVNNLSFWTANDFAERDPLTYEVYGFATAVTARSGTLNVAPSGTLLGSGTLTLPATRDVGPVTVSFENSTAYASYLVVFPTVKNSPSTTMMQIAEVQFGYNGVPGFVLSAATLTVAEDSGSFTQASFATGITPGVGDVGQTVSFAAANDNHPLFSTQPAISSNGTLTFTPAADANGTATVTVAATDSTGLSSAPQTFILTVTAVADVPVLAAIPMSSAITSNTATLGGEVIASDFPLSGRGVVYSITSTNAAPQIGGTGVVKVGNSTLLGTFTVNAVSLTPDTAYSFRAFATSTAGTSYSEVRTFTTRPIPAVSPSLQTLNYTYGTAISPTAAFTTTALDGPVTYTISPSASNLPAGLSLNPATGVITGRPTETWSFTRGCTVIARGAGGVTATAELRISVAKAPLSLAVNNKTRAYGAPNPAFSMTCYGLVNGDSPAVIGSVSFQTSATTTSAPGIYPVLLVYPPPWAISNYNVTGYWAGQLNITKAPQTITLAPLANSVPLKDLGSVNLTATSSTGLPVTLSLAAGSAATLSGTPGNYSLTDIGTTGIVTLLANQPGNANYAAAPQVVASFDVTKANQAITLAGLEDKTYGDAPVALAGTSDSGLAVSYAIASGPAILSGNSLVLTGAGTVELRASQSGNNSYNAAPAVERSFVVAPKPLTVAGAAAADKVSDGSNVASISGAHLVGVINGDDVSLIHETDGIFSQTSAGTGLSVTPAMELAGADADNYTLIQPVLTATITESTSHTHQELWRFANFGSHDSVDSGADSADPDGDGLSNLLEYALGLDPAAPGVMPVVLALNGANLEYTYTRSTAAKDNGVTYQIEWSETLEAGSWSMETVSQQITSTEGALETVKASVPAGTGGRRFLRLQVTGPAGGQ